MLVIGRRRGCRIEWIADRRCPERSPRLAIQSMHHAPLRRGIEGNLWNDVGFDRRLFGVGLASFEKLLLNLLGLLFGFLFGRLDADLLTECVAIALRENVALAGMRYLKDGVRLDRADMHRNAGKSSAAPI